VDVKFEVAVLPVADVDRSKAFYQGMGWRLDADINVAEDYRVVQFTPPNSPASIQFGQGITTMTPGSVQNLMLIVEDVQAARDELISHGAFEAVAPPHDWWDWYAAYMDARQSGSTQEEASAAAGRYMAEVKHVVV